MFLYSYTYFYVRVAYANVSLSYKNNIFQSVYKGRQRVFEKIPASSSGRSVTSPPPLPLLAQVGGGGNVGEVPPTPFLAGGQEKGSAVEMGCDRVCPDDDNGRWRLQ